MNTCYVKGCENNNEAGSIYCKDHGEIPESLITAEQAEKLEKSILDGVFSKCIENLRDDFYNKVDSYIYETHQNLIGKIMQEALDLIIGKQRAKYRDHYDMKELRAKLYEEHKDDIDKDITEQIIEENIYRVLGLFVNHKTTYDGAQIKNGICKWIYENYKDAELKNIIDEKFTQENERLRNKITYLNERLKEIGDLAE